MNPSPKTPFLRVLKHARFLHPVVRFFYQRSAPRLEKQLMGLTFAHPIGVAAGVDKRGEYTDAMACYSPAFIEVGPLRDCRFAIDRKWNRQKMQVVAMLHNYDGEDHTAIDIENAARAPLLDSSTDAVPTVAAPLQQTTMTFDLQGRPVKHRAKGLVIERRADGTVRKTSRRF